MQIKLAEQSPTKIATVIMTVILRSLLLLYFFAQLAQSTPHSAFHTCRKLYPPNPFYKQSNSNCTSTSSSKLTNINYFLSDSSLKLLASPIQLSINQAFFTISVYFDEVLQLTDDCRHLLHFRIKNQHVGIFVGEVQPIVTNEPISIRFYVSKPGKFLLESFFWSNPILPLSNVQITCEISPELHHLVSQVEQFQCPGADYRGFWVSKKEWKPVILSNVTLLKFSEYSETGYSIVGLSDQSAAELSYEWKPFCCAYRSFYNPPSDAETVSCIRDKWVHFHGDSVNRNLFYDFVFGMGETNVSYKKTHTNKFKFFSALNLTISMTWGPTYGVKMSARQIFSDNLQPGFDQPDIWIHNIGLHPALKDEADVHTYKQMLKESIISASLSQTSKSKVYFRLTNPISLLSRKKQVESARRVFNYNSAVRELLAKGELTKLVSNMGVFDAWGILFPRISG